jgi:O-antigen ligase
MAASPIISLSRAGAMVAFLLILGATAAFLFLDQKKPLSHRLGIAFGFLIALAFAKYLSWDALKPRFEAMLQGDLSGREDLFSNAIQMMRDFFWFGSGPGTFNPLYQLFITNPKDVWYAQAHSDWLEILITFGFVGFVMLFTAVLCVLVKWFIPKGFSLPLLAYMFPVLGLFGCLLHAIVDFPLQIHSVLFMFLINCSILSSCQSTSS